MTGAVRGSAPTRLSQPEFIALLAMIVSTTAFSIDAMLPALGTIADELTPDAPNRAQMIVTIFVLGMGVGTLFVGAFADAFGRRPVLLAGAGLYIAASALAWTAPTLEAVLAARFVQGIAASVPRVAAQAVIRDIYAGREMARMLSLVLMVFTLVPVLAPALGAVLIDAFGWRSIFPAFIVFSALSVSWFMLRQPETLDPANRRPVSLASYRAGFVEVFATPRVGLVILAQCFVFGILFVMLTTTQPVFDQAFGAAESFPYWFGFVALLSASGAFLNSLIVVRLGMRRVVRWAFAMLLLVALGFMALMAAGLSGNGLFAAYVAFMVAVFFAISLGIGNLNALAMEPLGHLAGMAASVIGAVSTVGGACLGMLAAAVFTGTPMAPALLIAVYCAAILFILWKVGDA